MPYKLISSAEAINFLIFFTINLKAQILHKKIKQLFLN